MRILVTGACGTLGRPLVRRLRVDGHEVFTTDLFHDGDLLHTRADVANLQQLERAFEASTPDAVYHLAAEFGRHNGELFTEQLWRTAMVGTRNVLELCRDFGAHLIFGSSSEVYGDLAHDLLTEEDLLPDVLPNEYALSKLTNEKQIRAFAAREPDLRFTILRFFNAYGPGEHYHPFRSVVALFCFKALRGLPLPVYEGYHRTFMYIDDFIPTLARVCEMPLRYDLYNIGGADYRAVEDLAQIVLAGVGRGFNNEDLIERIPEDAHNTRSKRPDIRRAAEDLGHDPGTLLEAGVPQTLDWMRRQLDRTRVGTPAHHPV